MLIRNATSLHDLQNKKKLQAEILQMQIDNEAIKEQRVSDYKNPNKPPPVPPQYKTSTEIQKDVMEQQKQTIDNLKSLGLDNQIASQISIDMKDLKEGDESYLKFNKFFPSFKTTVEKNVNIKAIGVDGILEEIRRHFYNIDNAMGLNLKGTDSTDYFNTESFNVSRLLPSKADYEDLINALNNIYDIPEVRQAIEEQYYDSLIKRIDKIQASSPTLENLKSIETFPLFERTKFNKDIETLIKIYSLPNNEFITNVMRTIGGMNPQEFIKQIALITKHFSVVSNKAIEKLGEFTKNIENEKQKLFDIETLYNPYNVGQLKEIERLGGEQALKELGGIERLQEIQKIGKSNLTEDVNSTRQNNLDYIENTIKSYTRDVLAKRITNPNTQTIDGKEVYGNKYKLNIPTINKEPPNGRVDNGDNIIYVITSSKKVGPKMEKTRTYRLRNGQEINIENNKFDVLAYDENDGNWKYNGGGQDDIGRYLYLKSWANKDYENTPMRYSSTYTNESMKKFIKEKEIPILQNKIISDANYRPASNIKSRIVEEEWDTSNQMMYPGWGIKEKKKKTKKKSKKYDSSSSSESSSEKMRDIHIDINSHNGKDYKMSGDGFIKRRIKIGKGIEIKKDEPKFRAFGKYIIHMPQLYNQNILNFKHKSGGTIPSIKPVNVNDNFKEFIIDVLNSGKVNDRHYDSLTEPEKNHFLKVVRGAGIVNDLKLKNANDDKEKEDIERLELLIGEYNAGNDNENMIKEAKILIKKYVSNGRISRQKGLEMLMEFD